MAQEKNTVLRVIVPIVLFAGAIVVGWAVMRNTSSHQQRPPAVADGGHAATPGPAHEGRPPAAPASPNEPTTGSASTPTANTPSPASAAAGASPAPALQPPAGNALAATSSGPTGVKALPWPALTPQEFTPIGSLSAPSGPLSPLARVTFSTIGAGIEQIEMADHFVAARPGSASVKVQEAARLVVRGRTLALVPFSLLGVTIDGTFVNLSASSDGPLWRETAPGAFEAIIVDDAGTPVARVRRAFLLVPGSHEITLDQSLENLSGAAFTVQWVQMGPVDPPSDSHNTSDLRRVRLGYLSPPAIDPEQTTVLADTRFLLERPNILGEPSWNQSLSRFEFATRVIWPDPSGRSERYSLAWISTTNHYFAAVLHAAPDRSPPRTDTPSGSALDKRLPAGGGATVDRIAITSETLDAQAALRDARFGLRFTSAPTSVAPGATHVQALGIYAGPMDKGDTKSPPVLAEMGLGGLVIYYLGGPCAWCMFQPVAASLHWYLQFLHDYVVFDWAIGITLLVLTLRTLLHPMTKWSQRSMIVMGKKMSGLAPKQKKLQEKFGGDPKRLREEQAKLMQEEGVGASSVLGCAPMFVQMLVNTPIWIGLSGAIFTAFDLRHEAAFYGVFQKIGAMFGGYWPFLADLSDQDRFIPLPFKISLWVINIDSVNILPFVLGFVFYFQQKYLTPPPTTQLTPEQEQQQKIMKIMMVVLFPVMMYNQPAALVLYFAVNSIFGSLEAAHIRKQFEVELKEREARGATEVRRRAPDRGVPAAHSPAPATGFFARLRQQLELAQKMREERQRQQQRDSKRTR
ncbi:MAG: membrane protein insertase YidC [Phycisphaerales bacterium]